MSNTGEDEDKTRTVVAWIIKIAAWLLLLAVVIFSYVYPHRQYFSNYIMRIKGTWKSSVPHCTSEERKHQIRTVCDSKKWGAFTHKDKDSSFYQNVIVDDQHQILYCAIPRVAEASFKTLLMTASDEQASLQHFKDMLNDRKYLKGFGLRFLDEFGDKERNWRLNNYFKFLAVRHPFERLYSTYMQKVVHTDYLEQNYLLSIMLKFGHKIKNEDGSLNMKLGDFIEFIEDPAHMDPLWQTYDSLCHPCEIPYDHIFKLETMETDSDPLLRVLSARGVTALPRVNVEAPLDKDKMLTASLALSSVSQFRLGMLQKAYEKDMEIFGYSWDDDTGMTCGVENFDGDVCC